MVATHDGVLLWSLWAQTGQGGAIGAAGSWGVDVLRFTEASGWTNVTVRWPQNHTVDQMAERIESLLKSQRRLLQDISHELRSPLARLGVILEAL